MIDKNDDKIFYYIAVDKNNKIITRQSSETEILDTNLINVSMEIFYSDCMENFWDKENKVVVINNKKTREKYIPTELEVIHLQQEEILKSLEYIKSHIKG